MLLAIDSLQILTSPLQYVSAKAERVFTARKPQFSRIVTQPHSIYAVSLATNIVIKTRSLGTLTSKWEGRGVHRIWILSSQFIILMRQTPLKQSCMYSVQWARCPLGIFAWCQLSWYRRNKHALLLQLSMNGKRNQIFSHLRFGPCMHDQMWTVKGDVESFQFGLQQEIAVLQPSHWICALT